MSTAGTKRSSLLERLAAESGVAVVVVDENAAEVAAANNNSICSQLYPSSDFGRACAEYCGKAFERATAAGGPIEYECHAGLFCRAMPVPESQNKLVAILGRTFVKTENYRSAAEKAASGEWRRFRPEEFFENVILSGSPAPVEKLEARIGGLEEPIIDEDAVKPKRGRTKPTSAPEPGPEPEPELETPQPDPFESLLLNYKLPTDRKSVV